MPKQKKKLYKGFISTLNVSKVNFTPLYCLLLLMLPCFVNTAMAQNTKPKNRILLIYDASNSMNARWQSNTKMNISKKLIGEILDSLSHVKNLELALRVYGHQSNYPPLDCDDSKLEVPFAPNNAKKVAQRIKSLVPRGSTPITYSLMQAANDFPPCDNCRNIIILITDGIEECGGDPCEASIFLQKRGIALKPFIIGIGANFASNFECVGEYFDASNEEDFIKAFDVIISHALNTTTAQINLLDINGEPNETNVNMTFYDNVSQVSLHNYIHTINYRGQPDTVGLDPLITYDIVVHTLPARRLDSVNITSGIHNIIAIDAAQGDLKMKMTGSRSAIANSMACIIRKHNSDETINVQYVNNEERYLIGNYDIEILSLPRIKLNNVEVKQNQTTTVDLPMPGIFVLKRNSHGISSLYSIADEGYESLIYTFENTNKIETLYLQPGKYRVVNRPKSNLRTSATRDKTFTIEPGVTETISF